MLKGKNLKRSKKNKSKWDYLKCRERDQSLPNLSSLKLQDFIPFLERNWNLYTYEVMLLSTFCQMLLESKLYFQYLFNHPGIMHYLHCIYVTVVYFGKVCVYIITCWMFSYQYRGVSFQIAQRYMYNDQMYTYIIHQFSDRSVSGGFCSQPLAVFSPSVLPTQLSGLL